MRGGGGLLDLVAAYHLEWLRTSGFQRRALLIADRFFNDAPGYVLGDLKLIERMSRAWNVLGAALELEEFASPLTTRDYLEVEKAKAGFK